MVLKVLFQLFTTTPFIGLSVDLVFTPPSSYEEGQFEVLLKNWLGLWGGEKNIPSFNLIVIELFLSFPKNIAASQKCSCNTDIHNSYSEQIIVVSLR